MNIRQRAETFSRYVGLELKGKIVSQQFTAKAVAEAIGRQPAAFNRWLNGKVEMPMTVLCEACEYIDIEPSKIVDDAYSRLAVDFGERDGRIYVPTERDEFGDLVPGGESVVGIPDMAAKITELRPVNVVAPEETLRAVAKKKSRDRGGDDGQG